MKPCAFHFATFIATFFRLKCGDNTRQSVTACRFTTVRGYVRQVSRVFLVFGDATKINGIPPTSASVRYRRRGYKNVSNIIFYLAAIAFLHQTRASIIIADINTDIPVCNNKSSYFLSCSPTWKEKEKRMNQEVHLKKTSLIDLRLILPLTD